MALTKKLVIFAVVLAVLIEVSLYLWKHGRPGGEGENPLAHADLMTVNRLVMTRPATTVTLEKTTDYWYITTPIYDMVDLDIPSDILAALRDFTLGSVVSENPAKYAQFHLDPATAVRLQVYAKNNPTPLLDGYIGKNTNGYENCYFRLEGSSNVHIAKGLPEFQFRREVEAFRHMRVLNIPSTEPSGVIITQGKSKFELSRSSHTWTLKSTGKVVEASLVQPLLQRLEQWNAVEFGTGKETPAELGYDYPSMVVEVVTPGGTAKAVVGKKARPPFPKAPDMRYAQSEGRAAVLMVREDQINDLNAALKSFR